MSSPYRIRNKPSKKSNDVLRAVIFLSIFSLVIGGFIYTVMIKKAPEAEARQGPDKYAPIFVEDLGKTARDLKKKYPELFFQKNKHGFLVAHQTMDGAQYRVWFVAENNDFRAFRLQSFKSYKALEEEEIARDFARLYGRPFDSQCNGQSTYADDKCHYKWWVRKNVSLDLYSRFLKDGNVTLSAITTDTYLASKHFDKIKAVIPTQ